MKVDAMLRGTGLAELAAEAREREAAGIDGLWSDEGPHDPFLPKAVARRRLAGGQGELELGLDAAAVVAAGPGPLQIESSRMAPLWDGLCAAQEAKARALGNGVIVVDTQVAGRWKRTVRADTVVLDTVLCRPFDAAETAALHGAADKLGMFLGARAVVSASVL